MSWIYSNSSIPFSSALSSASSTRPRFDSSPKFTSALGGTVVEPKITTSIAEPLLLSAVRGEDVQRPPVWLMRQAGRYMKSRNSALAHSLESPIAHISDGRKHQRFERQALVDLLRDCVNEGLLQKIKAIHGFLLKSEYSERDLLILSNHVIHAYSKCYDFSTAYRVFDQMTKKNMFSWTVMIVGSTENGFFLDGLYFFFGMLNHDILPDKYAYSAILQTCIGLGSVELGKMLHAQIVVSGFASHTFVTTSLFNMYAKLQMIEDSFKVFSTMNQHNQVSWNAMISGFESNALPLEAYNLFLKMKEGGVKPNMYTIISVSKAVGKLADIEKCKTVHSYASEFGMDSTVRVGTALIDMYSKCGCLSDAQTIFYSNFTSSGVNMPWNAMISCYSQCSYNKEAMELFVTMCENSIQPDIYTYCSIFNVIAASKYVHFVKEVHAMTLKSVSELKISVWNAIADAYAKCGLLEDVEKIFESMDERDIVSWTTLMTAYSQHSRPEDALVIFSKMREEGCMPNQFTFSTVLDICASLCFLEYGQQVHGLLCKAGLDTDKCTESSLVDMYAKCGCVTNARKAFEKILDPDTVSWTAIISCYAQHGLADDAFQLFRRMEQSGIEVNAVTLLCIIFACSHQGMVDEGLYYFQQMEDYYDLVPEMEHYACIVDLLGRVGHLNDAMNFIEKMPIEPNEMVWQTLLGACRVHGSADLGEIAAQKILSIRPEFSATYVLLSNTYIKIGNYEEAIGLRNLMKDRGVKKEAGCSWISVKSRIHRFYAGDQLHPQKETIYSILEELRVKMKSMGYVPDLSDAL